MAANIFRNSNLPYLILAAAMVAALSLPTSAMAQSPAALFQGKSLQAKKPKPIALPFVQPSEIEDAPMLPPGGKVNPKFAQPSELGDETSTGPQGAFPPGTTAPPVDGGADVGAVTDPNGGQPIDPNAGLPVDPSEEVPSLPSDPSGGLPIGPNGGLPQGQPMPQGQPLPGGPSKFPGGPMPVNPGGINPADLYHPNGGYMQPGDLFCHPQQQCHYKLITTWTYKQVPCQVRVLRYDHCGNPYYGYITQYKTVKVPVTQYVKVCN